ncbi:hypothetical protein FLP10_15020 [Agromyces intestinalis]|uniref:DUF4190 domain-containing protein n=1 Tax=Agromyces intestinalis TaxID=2592652 RepID=A0A5C1YHD1_9MICO|nr:hypothetical protein [Agromyces intestinalis]QEO15594.1 hypothetical protein FLP10_15020 [Agromyces intestinalis]
MSEPDTGADADIPVPTTRSVWDYVKPTAAPTVSTPIQPAQPTPGLDLGARALLPETQSTTDVLAAAHAGEAQQVIDSASAAAQDLVAADPGDIVEDVTAIAAASVPSNVQQAVSTAFDALPADLQDRAAAAATRAATSASAYAEQAVANAQRAAAAVPVPTAPAVPEIPRYGEYLPQAAGNGNLKPNTTAGTGAAIASIVLAILGGIFALIPVLSYFAVAGAIFGIVLGNRAKRAGAAAGTAGVALSVLTLILSVVTSIAYTAVFASM